MAVQTLNIIIYIWVMESLGSIVLGQVAHARAILVLRECFWNVPEVSLVIPAFDSSGSLGSPPRQGVYHPGSMVLPW